MSINSIVLLAAVVSLAGGGIGGRVLRKLLLMAWALLSAVVACALLLPPAGRAVGSARGHVRGPGSCLASSGKMSRTWCADDRTAIAGDAARAVSA